MSRNKGQGVCVCVCVPQLQVRVLLISSGSIFFVLLLLPDQSALPHFHRWRLTRWWLPLLLCSGAAGSDQLHLLLKMVDIYCELVGTSPGTTSSPTHRQRDRETSRQKERGTLGHSSSFSFPADFLKEPKTRPRICWNRVSTGGRQQNHMEKPGSFIYKCVRSSTNIVHKSIWLFWCERNTQSFLVSALYGFQNVSDVVTAPLGVPGGGRPCRPRTTTGTWGASTRTNI